MSHIAFDMMAVLHHGLLDGRCLQPLSLCFLSEIGAFQHENHWIFVVAYPTNVVDSSLGYHLFCLGLLWCVTEMQAATASLSSRVC